MLEPKSIEVRTSYEYIGKCKHKIYDRYVDNCFLKSIVQEVCQPCNKVRVTVTRHIVILTHSERVEHLQSRNKAT